MSRNRQGRQDRLLKQKRHDAYRERGKLREPTICPECGALFANGRWCWATPPAKTNETLCPACRRTLDNLPAGYIELKGDFFREHYDEILNLTRNIEKQEKNERPLERIMAISDQKDHTMVTTTGVHIARRIGEALSRSYNGDFSFQYADEEKSIRVCWRRT